MCSGIYDVKGVNYPNQSMEEYQNYNFAVLKLYNELSDSCGYVGWKTACKPAHNKLITYGYINDNQKGSFALRQITKNQKSKQNWKGCSGSGVLFKGKANKYYIVGLHNRSQGRVYSVLSERIRNMVNQWTHVIQIQLKKKKIVEQGCKYLSQGNLINLTKLNLDWNSIGSQGCKYLSQAKWIQLRQLSLSLNNIGSQGCKHLSDAKFMNLIQTRLNCNHLGTQGCKYLSLTNWIYLTNIDLYNNSIDAQGCKYLSQANWIYLTNINLNDNHIDAQGCKQLSQVNWVYLIDIDLSYNSICVEGCRYLIQAGHIVLKLLI